MFSFYSYAPQEYLSSPKIHSGNYLNYTNTWFVLWGWLKYILKIFFNVHDKQIEAEPKVKTNEQIFIENETKQFISTFNSSPQLYNQSLDLIFYNIEKYNMLMTNENDLEKKWKSKILFTSSPRGNIIMYYDCYKRGFAYYCDSQTMSYELLNIVAMKYVRIYLCRDLYVDNKLNIDVTNSPLISLIHSFEKNEKYKSNKIDIEKIKNAPFAKLKNYNIVKPPPINCANFINTKSNISTNNFIYLGKICNFGILQKKTFDVSNKKTSYKDYVKQKKQINT